jgi:hypothetical protein
MSRWFVWIGCGLVGIGFVPTLADYLPVDIWGFLMDRRGTCVAGVIVSSL